MHTSRRFSCEGRTRRNPVQEVPLDGPKGIVIRSKFQGEPWDITIFPKAKPGTREFVTEVVLKSQAAINIMKENEETTD